MASEAVRNQWQQIEQEIISMIGAVGHEHVIDIQSFVAMFNKMKKEIKFAPPPTKIEGQFSYELFDIVDGFSEPEMSKLGRFVAAIAICGMFVDNTPAIRTNSPLAGNAKDGRVLPEKALAKFVHWFRNNISVSKTYAKVTGLGYFNE